MKSFNTRRIIALFLVLALLPACNAIFETSADIQARQALKDLMAIQEEFHQKENRYAKNLMEIQDYNLKYHSGIVYLEIQSAGKNKYRAITLPAESTTARAFAFDTEKGGYYEMGEEEVAEYVLGSLNYIRQQQKEQKTVDMVSGGLVLVLSWLGFKLWIRFRNQGAGWVLLPYFLSIPPLTLAVAAINHMNRDIAMQPLLSGLIWGSIAVSAAVIVLGGVSFKKVPMGEAKYTLTNLAVCTIVIGVFNIVALTQIWSKYSEPPGPGDTYFIPAQPQPR